MTRRNSTGENHQGLPIPAKAPLSLEPTLGRLEAHEPSIAGDPKHTADLRSDEVPSNAIVEISKAAFADETNGATSFLTFEVGGKEYGIPVLGVREIADYVSATRVPGTPAYIRGVMNLRGNVVPVLDLRVKLGLGPVEAPKRSSIVFVNRGATDASLVGLLVESVHRVIALEKEEIDDAPALGTNLRVDYLTGIGRAGGALVLLLAIDVILGAPDHTTSRNTLGFQA